MSEEEAWLVSCLEKQPRKSSLYSTRRGPACAEGFEEGKERLTKGSPQMAENLLYTL